jgi:hypothetical protein
MKDFYGIKMHGTTVKKKEKVKIFVTLELY